MIRSLMILACLMCLSCGDEKKDEASVQPPLGQPAAGEQCGKLADCAVGLTCGVDYRCFDPTIAYPEGAPRSLAESSGVQSQSSGEPGPMVELGQLNVNLKDPAGGKFLMTKLQLELDSEDSRAEVEQRIGSIRYELTRLLSEQTSSDCQGKEQMEILRKQMLRRANSRLNRARIKEVWPTEWIVG